MSFILKPEIHIKTIKADKLFHSYQLLTVRSYCENCNCHGHNYSCPPYAPTGDDYVDKSKEIALFLTLLDTKLLSENMEYLKTQEFHSQTLDDYNKRGNQLSIYTAISMYAFDDMKLKIQERLFALESEFDFISLPPGKCSLCPVCQKKLGNPCAKPKQLRFSLESLGFLVSDLMLEHFDYQIQWAENDFSPHFTTLSAMILNKEIDEEEVKSKFDDISIVF